MLLPDLIGQLGSCHQLTEFVHKATGLALDNVPRVPLPLTEKGVL